MKKLTTIVGIILLILPMFYLAKTKEKDVSDNVIIASELNAKKENEIYVLVGNKECSACNEFIPIISKAVKEVETEVHYMDTDDSSNLEFLKKQNINATPTLIKLDSTKKIISRFEGVLSLDDTKKILKGGKIA